RRLFLRGVFTGVLVVPCLAGAAPASVDYGRDVRPILSNQCFQCHGPDEAVRQGGLRLDTAEGAATPGRSGLAAIVPGSLESSELIRRILSDDPDEQMPPPDSGKTLTPAAR